MNPAPGRASRRLVLALLLGSVALGGPLGCGRCEPTDETLTVFAAASLTDVLPKVAAAWRARGGAAVRFSWGATSKIVPQVLAGAPADAVFSADAAWMDRLESEGGAEAGTRRVVATNGLVYIVPAEESATPRSMAAVVAAPPRRLALAGTNVPAGTYARAGLEQLGAWRAVESAVLTAEDVRMALGWVASGEAEAGIVYRTDAAVEPRVRVAFEFPPGSHPPIVYSAAVVKGSAHAASAQRFLDYGLGPEARALFAAAGFGPPGT